MTGSASPHIPHRVTRVLGLLGALLVAAALALWVHAIQSRIRYARATSEVLARVEALIPTAAPGASAPLTGEGEGTLMPSVSIDGVSYCGILKLSFAGSELPVRSVNAGGAIEVAPYCLDGMPTSRMVIVGWDGNAQFGSLSRAGIDDAIIFVDVDGMSYSYHVNSLIIQDEFDVSDASMEHADLVLCTYDSASNRYLVLLASRD